MLTVQPKTSSMGQILAVLKKGGLVVAPSDTVYGLLVDATNEQAVKKLIAFKNRPWGKPISVFVSDRAMLEDLVDPGTSKQTLQELLPGPFTVILPSRGRVSSLLESEKGTLGVRLPNDQFIRELVKRFGRPVTATSANISGRPPHYQVKTLFKELSQEKKKLIDAVVDGGVLKRNKPSTIVDLSKGKLTLLRKGDVVFLSSKTYLSRSPSDTRRLAQYFLRKETEVLKKKPVVFILQGELGTGKTEFVKGAAEVFGVRNIISPTYVVYYEYDHFVHADLYTISDPEEFKPLKLERYLRSGQVLFLEWGERIGDTIDAYKKKAKIIWIHLKHHGEKERTIHISA